MRWAILLALLATFGCNPNSQLPYEEQLWECWVENAANQGLDLKADFKKFEKYLVLGGLLNGTSGQDYYDLFQKWHDSGDINPSLSDDALDSLRELPKHKISFESNCYQQFLPKLSKHSVNGKIAQMNKAVEKIMNSGDVGPSNIIEPLLNNFSPSDLDKPFYKVYSLLYVQSLIAVDARF